MMKVTQIYNNIVKSPLNYIGGKQKILNQLLPLFPTNINKFVDLFAGGCNVGLNANAEEIYFNDILIYLIEMYRKFQEIDFDAIIKHIQNRINEYNLSLTNEDGYKQLREFYNKNKNPLDLFILVSYSFNHQIRFNNNHEFNNPFGRDRSNFNNRMEQNLKIFHNRLQQKKVKFISNSFEDFDFQILNKDDFVYCDPPYLISTGTYNDGRRGFKGWADQEEKDLLKVLDNLNSKKIKFGLSNVLEHKGKSNTILKNWLNSNPDYRINYIKSDYSNSNYQTAIKAKDSSVEVLITNYEPTQPVRQQCFFS
ncbi:MAG: Dam family site-specific DNA-(adenine-N6)-methyltransferase [Desulfamplus sp.]|nr:Dam family site-specific DNA-(adenine-N6)-methyltransferase [Desulfamplus sp.]